MVAVLNGDERIYVKIKGNEDLTDSVLHFGVTLSHLIKLSPKSRQILKLFEKAHD